MSENPNETPVVVPAEAPAAPAEPALSATGWPTPTAAPATPVVVNPPSSSVVQEVVADVERVVVSVEDAVRGLVALVKDGRRAGDVDVENAITDVHAALAAKQ